MTPKSSRLAEALEFRREANERAKGRVREFFGMNEDRPPEHDINLYEAAQTLMEVMENFPPLPEDMSLPNTVKFYYAVAHILKSKGYV